MTSRSIRQPRRRLTGEIRRPGRRYGIIRGEGFEIAVSEPQKKADDLFVHLGKVVRGKLATGAVIEMRSQSMPAAPASAPTISRDPSGARGAGGEVLATHAPRGLALAPENRLRLRFFAAKPIALRASYRQWGHRQLRSFCRTRPVTNAPHVRSIMICRGRPWRMYRRKKYGDEVRVVRMGTAFEE